MIMVGCNDGLKTQHTIAIIILTIISHPERERTERGKAREKFFSLHHCTDDILAACTLHSQRERYWGGNFCLAGCRVVCKVRCLKKYNLQSLVIMVVVHNNKQTCCRRQWRRNKKKRAKIFFYRNSFRLLLTHLYHPPLATTPPTLSLSSTNSNYFNVVKTFFVCLFVWENISLSFSINFHLYLRDGNKQNIVYFGGKIFYYFAPK